MGSSSTLRSSPTAANRHITIKPQLVRVPQLVATCFAALLSRNRAVRWVQQNLGAIGNASVSAL
jgi:hypothetical protein